MDTVGRLGGMLLHPVHHAGPSSKIRHHGQQHLANNIILVNLINLRGGGEGDAVERQVVLEELEMSEHERTFLKNEAMLEGTR